MAGQLQPFDAVRAHLGQRAFDVQRHPSALRLNDNRYEYLFIDYEINRREPFGRAILRRGGACQRGGGQQRQPQERQFESHAGAASHRPGRHSKKFAKHAEGQGKQCRLQKSRSRPYRKISEAQQNQQKTELRNSPDAWRHD
jgi:hypothetical protein